MPSPYYTPKDESRKLIVICKLCGKEKRTWHKHMRYCSAKCRNADMVAPAVAHPGISAGSRGAIGELAVSIDLMKKGFEVFRNVSPHGDCDLIIMKNGSVARVEVRSASKNAKTGKVYTPTGHGGKADILAIYTWDEILYDPPFEAF
jgi:endogenous inhibitor of DNA gyrase (YacG/DUF329 family)